MNTEKLTAFLHFGGPFTDKQPCCKLTIGTACKIDLLEWQKKGLSYTSTGYGRKIPTQYKVLHENKWKRVYCCIYSNSGTFYIESDRKPVATVDIYNSDEVQG